MSERESRTTTKNLGDEAEELVARWLERQGIVILGRNVRLGRLEIDIVARDGPLILIVEVRRRNASSFTSGYSSLSHKKRQRIRYAGERLWNRVFRNDPSVERLRFDAASVTFGSKMPRLEYAPAAF